MMRRPDAIQRRHIVLGLINAAYLLGFACVFWQRKNSEFLMYVVTVTVAVCFVGVMHLRYRFSFGLLLGLSAWGLLHMLGGAVIVGDDVLYGVQLIRRVLRFDQFVHAFGFGYATLFCYDVLRPNVRADAHWFSVSVIVLMAGIGVGAVNEMVEFLAVLCVPETGVGGYENTMWDIVFNTLGAIIAVTYGALARRRLSGCVRGG